MTTPTTTTVARTHPAEVLQNPYRPGTMSHKLFAEIFAQEPISRRPPPPKEEPRPVRKVMRVRATFAGTSRPNPNSVRMQVLRYVQDSPDSAATVEAIEQHFRQPVRGYLQKLIDKGHLVATPMPAAPVPQEPQQ
jgi:hypothetical protein